MDRNSADSQSSSASLPRSVAVLYATVSGNAEQLAQLAANRLTDHGFAVLMSNVADFPAARLKELDTALVIASTWGEGEPPPDAAAFCAGLRQPAGLSLPHLRYAVLALGSSSYTAFCGCGRQIDEDLARRGAHRLLPRIDCDTKFKSVFERWLEDVRLALTQDPPT